jgi:hypothetical protein
MYGIPHFRAMVLGSISFIIWASFLDVFGKKAGKL